MALILIVDDDPAIQLLLKRTLTNRGYEVSVASDGAEGLAMAKKLTPALMICDWVMPRMNGIEVCSRIKSIPELSTTFFILLTSKGSVEDRVEGLDAGADDFLCKPIEMFELQARVRSGLRLHQLSSDLQRQKQILETELAEAAEYVCSILPEPLQESNIAIDVCFIPSSQLGGDSFDFYWLDEEHLVMYLLDVSGHGLRAALPSVSVINLLRSKQLLQVNYRKPSDVLRGLNETFQMTQRNDKYFTIWYGVYNKTTRQLVYSSAGHPPAILLSPALNAENLDEEKSIQVDALKAPGFPVGMFPEADYEEHTCKIDNAASLYLFSDGIYELDLPNGEMWRIDDFIEELKQYYQHSDRHLDRIIDRVKEINSSDRFDDDLSLVEVQFD
ncbi:MAG: SpoIIE family protein phosphatase [Cyanobacteria bacterium P01_E01_bin.42]